MPLEALRCPNCGAPLEHNQNYCDHCGIGLKSTDQSDQKGRGFNISIEGKDKTYTYGFSFDAQPKQGADSQQGTYNFRPTNTTQNTRTNTYAQSSSKTAVPSSLSREVALILAFISLLFLCGVALHKVYLKRTGDFVLSLFFFWTGIPAIICLFNCISLATMTNEAFHQKFG
ncbi:MAG TPA: zinc-ribbon domain-containing protein [Clostridiales bacterium]|jgi:TM2 domain-containing membrane protein YozV|nr:zinc-ribbon domain-containing protein [Clostridiales bacterium]